MYRKPCNINGLSKCFVVLIYIFSLFDEERCEDFAEQAINPFSTESLIICALDWLKAHPNRVQQAIEAEFDCLIVDRSASLALV